MLPLAPAWIVTAGEWASVTQLPQSESTQSTMQLYAARFTVLFRLGGPSA